PSRPGRPAHVLQRLPALGGNPHSGARLRRRRLAPGRCPALVPRERGVPAAKDLVADAARASTLRSGNDRQVAPQPGLRERPSAAMAPHPTEAFAVWAAWRLRSRGGASVALVLLEAGAVRHLEKDLRFRRRAHGCTTATSDAARQTLRNLTDA